MRRRFKKLQFQRFAAHLAVFGTVEIPKLLPGSTKTRNHGIDQMGGLLRFLRERSDRHYLTASERKETLSLPEGNVL